MVGYVTAGSLQVRQPFTTDLEKAAKSLRIPISSVSSAPYNPYVEVLEALKKFEDGWTIRLNGINSALISDQGDAPGKLLVSDFQTSHFEHTDGVIDIALCHHPPEWLMDKNTIRDALSTFAPVALFGHEHSTRIVGDAKQIQLFAGAVQPSRRDPGDWLPTYHILQLTTSEETTGPRLTVRIHTREFDKQNYRFRPRRNENDEPVVQHLLKLRSSSRKMTMPSADVFSTPPSNMPTDLQSPEGSMPTKTESAQRDLLVRFFRLPTPDRYASANEAGLLRDGDDALQPQVMWAEVFRRAASEARGLANFWTAVASRDNELKGLPNPFEE